MTGQILTPVTSRILSFVGGHGFVLVRDPISDSCNRTAEQLQMFDGFGFQSVVACDCLTPKVTVVVYQKTKAGVQQLGVVNLTLSVGCEEVNSDRMAVNRTGLKLVTHFPRKSRFVYH